MFLAKIEISLVFDFAFKGLFLVLWLYSAIFVFMVSWAVIGVCLMLFLVDLYQGFVWFLSFLKNNLQNIWWEEKFCIPLHSLYKTSHLASYLKHIKKEFFEKIYINREVVQEASVWLRIK